MKPKLSYVFSLLTIIMMSCGSNHEYWDLSKFNIDNQALKNNEEIKLLYACQPPDYNKDSEYYIHLIAVSQDRGDTVNILTTVNSGITGSDKNRIFTFFDKDHAVSKITQLDFNNINDLKNIGNINETSPEKFKKVVRDPRFDDIADNNYPAIFGSIGTTEKNKE